MLDEDEIRYMYKAGPKAPSYEKILCAEENSIFQNFHSVNKETKKKK
jgi:hypothetical protein